MVTKEKKIIEVIMMKTDFFLYLPFYYAEKENFFGYLPEDYQVRLLDKKRRQEDQKNGKNPEEYDTDQEVCEALLNSDNRKNGKNYYFAIADPTKIIQQNSNPGEFNQLMILSALVTNTAFWAITTNTSELKHLGNLIKFKQILSYPEGTTSYGLACRILQLKKEVIVPKRIETLQDINTIKDEHNLIIISPEQEALFFSYLQDEHRGKQSVALYPDILTLFQEKYRDIFIDYMLGQCTEFNNLMVTALIAHTDLKNQQNYEKLIVGILRGIQKATMKIYSLEECITIESSNEEISLDLKKLQNFQKIDTLSEIINSVSDKFADLSDTMIQKALIKAINYKIFPRLIEISKADWENAVIVSAIAQKKLKPNQDNKVVADQIDLKDIDWEKYSSTALLSYNTSIINYQQYAKQAINLEIYQPIFKELPKLQSDKETLTNEKNSLTQEKNSLTQEKNSLTQEKNSLTQEKNSNKQLVILTSILLFFALFYHLYNWFNIKNYSVTVKTQNKQPVINLAVQYSLDNQDSFKSFITHKNGVGKITIFRNTKEVKFIVKDLKNYADLEETVKLANHQTSYNIHLNKITNETYYVVSVETTDSKIVEGLTVQYQLDNKGAYEPLITETGGAQEITIFENTKKINFKLTEHKEYEDFNKTVNLNQYPDSYKIILVRRMTPIASSPQQTGTIKLKVRLIWFGTTQGIEGAELRLFDGTSPLGNKKTTDIGYTEFNVPRKGGLTIQVKHPELKQDGQMISVQDLSDVEGDSADLYKELSKK